MDITIPLQPKQSELMYAIENSPHSIFGLGGARGGAKSHGVRSILLYRRLLYPKTSGLLFRRTYGELKANHIDPLFRQFPELRAGYNVGDAQLTLPNGSWLRFGYAENPSDILDFQGQEFTDVGIDEATLISQGQVEYLRTCNRDTSGTGVKPCMILSMNPGGPGHAYIKRLFVDKKYHENEKPGDYCFIRANGWDNWIWSENALTSDGLTDSDYYSWTDSQRFEYFVTRSDYGRKLDSLPGSLREAHLLGSWSSFAGQYFSTWDPARMVIPAALTDLKPWNNRWLSCDWGHTHPCAIYWHAKRDDGIVVTYRELVVREKLAREIGQLIVSHTTPDEKLSNFYLSPDAFELSKRKWMGSQDTISGLISDALPPGFPRPTKAVTDRVNGFQQMAQMLHDGAWLISDACPRAIEKIPLAMRDDSDPEDVLKQDANEYGEGGDDEIESLRYGVKSHILVYKKPFGVRVQERVEAKGPQTMTARHMMTLAAIDREKQADKDRVAVVRPKHRFYGGHLR
jgi:Phage terminase large subunit